jgi:hypothetical protein
LQLHRAEEVWRRLGGRACVVAWEQIDRIGTRARRRYEERCA